VDLTTKDFNGSKQTFLVDTGCSRCLIRYDAVAHPERIQKNPSLMKGIGGSIKMLGILPVNMFNKTILFRVVQELPINVEGFLGSDFFQIFQVEINYEHQKLRFRNDLQEIEIPMSTNDANCFVVNERCETYQRIRTSATHECVIEPQEIAEGV
jgi:hypothetical protein